MGVKQEFEIDSGVARGYCVREEDGGKLISLIVVAVGVWAIV